MPGRGDGAEARPGQDHPLQLCPHPQRAAHAHRGEAPRRRRPLPKLDWKTAPREDIHAALTLSGQGMEQLLQHRAARTRPDRWSLATFLAYAIAHEAHHRSQIEIALRLGGHEPDDKDLYALWDWTKLAPAAPTD